MTEQQTISWAPSASASRKALTGFGIGGGVIGLVGFAVSFDSVSAAARPYLGLASWTLPVLIDLGIFVLTGLSLFLEMTGIRSRLIRAVPLALALYTLFLNTATQPSVFGKAVHAAGPGLWIVVVEIGAYTLRHLVGLSDEQRLEGLRRSLWLLRPLATFRIWRQMRIHQVTRYRDALDRDAARAAVVGRLRLHHGRMWRAKAPLAERIALRLEGRDPVGVADALGRHRATADLLAGVQQQPVPAEAAEPVAGEIDTAVPVAPVVVVEPVAEDTPADVPQAPAEPVVKRAPARTRKTAGKPAKTPTVRRTEAALLEAAQALNAEHTAATGTAVSLRRLKAELRVGQPRAERLHAAVTGRQDPAADAAGVFEVRVVEPVPATVGYANGYALEDAGV